MADEAIYISPGTFYFARYNSSTSNKAAKPSFSSSHLVGTLDRLAVTIEHVRREIRKPSPGSMRRVDILALGQVSDATGTLRDFGALALELMYGTGQLTAGSSEVYNPDAAPAEVKGWMHFQQYDQTETLRNTVDRWCSIRLPRYEHAIQEIELPVEISFIDSTLNVGTFVTLATQGA